MTARALAGFLTLALAIGCSVDDAAFEARVFTCDTAARDPHCGNDANGQPMTCFPASQLDGTDFCTQSCGEPMSLPAEDAVCVQGGAKLASCNPDDTTTPNGPCGRTDLGCLRTDVTIDEGVCVTMQPCSQDSDCPNPVRSTCAATFLTKLYAQNPDLHSDHLYCLQEGCVADGSNCGAGQACLPKLVAAAAHPPDICVPNCDSQDRCPPNHFCFSKLSGPGSPHICLPGLLGFECESDIDCMVGRCVSDDDPALPLRLCSVPCNNDPDCTKFDSDQGKFVCQQDRNQCSTPDAYRGARCYTDADCTRDPGTSCVFASTPTKSTDQGTCSRLCPGGVGPCTPRGGFGHVCLSFTVARDGTSKPGCYPGYFPFPCTADDNCVGENVACRNTGGTPSKICTALCQTDADCDANRWTAGQAFCANSICLPKLGSSRPCQTSNQCQSNVCSAGSCG
ncbi:MAG TPA: hypothetical protein VKQ32_14695 [Polyangia bacterium]|nr:hypothetical protein [Polyangia bacterium]